MATATTNTKPVLSGPIAFLDRYPFLVLAVVLVGAFASSSSAPLGGLFVVEGLGEAPWKISLAAAIKVIVTLLTNRYYGHAIDRGVPVRWLLLSSIICFVAGMVVIGTFQVYWVYAVIGSVLIGVGSGALSVVYSFGRLFAEQTGRDVRKFNSLLRMQTSLGWMIGPAVSLSVYGAFGFTFIFFAIAILGAAWLLFCLLVVPSHFKTHHAGTHGSKTVPKMNSALLLACIPVFFIATGNVVFITAMPLYFTQSLGLAPSAAGFELTVKCFVEVFAIYASVGIVQRMGERKGLMLAAFGGVIFYGLIYQAQNLWHVLALGALDGLYYGLFSAIGMTFVQNFARNRPGMATSYYVSTLFVGGLSGNLLMGIIANYYSYHITVAVSGVFVALGVVTLLLIGDAPPEEETVLSAPASSA